MTELDVTNKTFPSNRPHVDDGSLLLKAREATNDQCVDLTLAQAKTSMCMISLHFFKALMSWAVPNFWQKVQSYADERYGKGSRNILMYDKHVRVLPLDSTYCSLILSKYPDVHSAKVCVTSQAVQIKTTGSDQGLFVVFLTHCHQKDPLPVRPTMAPPGESFLERTE